MMTGYRTPEIAFAPPEQIAALQNRLLARHLRHCAENSPYYRRRFREWGLDPTGISLDTIHRIPSTSKQELAAHNDEFIAAGNSTFADIALTSGTTASPVRIPYTESDLQRLAWNEEMSFRACGVEADNVVLLTCTMERCFIAGLAYYLGLRACGATVIRGGLSPLDRHAHLIAETGANVIVGVPSFLKRLGLRMGEAGWDPASSPVRRLICIGEPLRNRDLTPTPLATRLREIWSAPAFSTYASTECPCTFCECESQHGGHLHPSLAIMEILDPEGNPVAAGDRGEVVITPLEVEGTPLLRFKTGDVSWRIDEPCACGRTTPRLGPIMGRKNQMLKIRGVSLFPQAVFDILEGIEEITEYCAIATTTEDGLDDLEILYAAEKPLEPSTVSELLAARLRISLVTEKKDLDVIRSYVHHPENRKPLRFHDRRQSQ